MLSYEKLTTPELEINSTDQFISLKKQALENFSQTGFPTRKTEHWKYINLANFLKEEFLQEKYAQSEQKNNTNNNANISLNNLISLSKLKPHPFANLCIANSDASNIEHITIYNSSETDCPIEINITLNESLASQKILLIEASENIQAELVINFNSSDLTPCVLNNLIFIKLNTNSKLNIYSQQDINLSSYLFNAIFIEQDKFSELNYFSLDKGGKLARTDIETDFHAEHASCNLSGLILASQDQVIDHHNIIRHTIGHCISSENFKTVIKDKAKVIFNGKIIMNKGAKKSETKQSNKNLLLSPKAEIYTKPELEIYADDVKAAHGAATGQLDKEALYYLKTRGFTETDARNILLEGFIKEIILNIPNKKIISQWEELLAND